ncbi:Protein TRIGALACTOSYLDIACYLGLYCEROL 2, chloroplastic [Glycine max]|nr:Protein TRIGALACTOSYLDIACYLGLYCEROL 2, chloroplastic [Glycine max]
MAKGHHLLLQKQRNHFQLCQTFCALFGGKETNFLRPLSDFGFSDWSNWEGGVGLFLVSGAVLFYTVVFEYTEACGISKGTPVRIRGATAGNVIGVNPFLKSIEAVVEVGDDKTVISRNSLIKVNQSGLLMETKIDITPREPIPTPSVGPLHQDCTKEGLIVCDREKINSDQGTSLDTLVGIYFGLDSDRENWHHQ